MKRPFKVFIQQALTCIAEAPEGRRILLDHIDVVRFQLQLEQTRIGVVSFQFKARMLDPLVSVAKHAKIAVDVITWKP